MRTLLTLPILSRLLPLLIVANGLACLGQNAKSDSQTLTTVAQVAALTNKEAARSIPVRVEGIVTYLRPSEKHLFISDGKLGIYVRWGADMGLLPGDRVLVTGVSSPSFKPVILADKVGFIGHGALPKAQPATFAELIRAQWDSQYVEISGHVVYAAAERADTLQNSGMRLRVAVPLGMVECVIANRGNLTPKDLLESDVRLQGVAGGEYDSKMQLSGVWLDMYTPETVTILHPPTTDPWSSRPIPLDRVVSAYRYTEQSDRVLIRGRLTYFMPGSTAVIEADGKSIRIKTRDSLPLHTGMIVEATGFPTISDQVVYLEDAELRPISEAAPVQPPTINWEDASAGKFAYDQVAMEGEVVGMVHDARIDMFIVESEGHLFSASLRHSSSDFDSGQNEPNRPAILPTIGSRVRVTGVCFVDPGNHWSDRLWFNLRMRSMSDVVVLQKASWWSIKRLAFLTMLLSCVVLASAGWVWLLDRRLRKQSALLARQSQEDAIRERTLARLEQQRSHILELITSSVPLTEVLNEIRSFVSSRLNGSFCWFELNASSGAEMESGLSVGAGAIQQELFSPDGVSMGFLLASCTNQGDFDGDLKATLAAGARLAELAIDTRRLYTDLRRRSEYDLLTDVANRFSMEKHLDRIIQSSGHTEAIFGLIYIDLDRFKQVNDRYGHRTGDMYLQAVTRRMKAQLRGGDVLARVGGDEFIALVPILRSRSDAEDIALRLERCFDEPFDVEGYRLYGSASMGLAVYPVDGVTKEELQRYADTAMYEHKELRRLADELTDSIMEQHGGENMQP